MLKQSKPVLVDFHALWCSPCHVIAPFIEAAQLKYPAMEVAKVDVDMVPDIAAMFGVTSIPTLAFIRNEVLLKIEVGAIPQNKLNSTIETQFGFNQPELTTSAASAVETKSTATEMLNKTEEKPKKKSTKRVVGE